MKKNIYWVFVFLSGCASFVSDSPLYEGYLDYKTLVKNNKNIDYTNFFSTKLIRNLDLNDPSINSQLQFINYIHSEFNHYERRNGNTGCLTINGSGDNNSAIAFYLEYEKINENWKISDIDISFVESKNDFKKQALCPTQTRVQ